MRLTDKIYGTFEIEEPVSIELLESQAVQRLKGVLQHGITGLIGITFPTSRYEHSVGVMLLARRLGATLDEQYRGIAARCQSYGFQSRD